MSHDKNKIHDKKGNHMHSKHEMREKFQKHRHKIPGYLARELAAKVDVPEEIAKSQNFNKDMNKPSDVTASQTSYMPQKQSWKKNKH